MAKPTSTRKQLRQLICKELSMPFHKRFGSSSLITGKTDTTHIIDSNLAQSADYWNNTWFLSSDSSGSAVTRLVTDFTSASGLVLEYATTGSGISPTTGDEYELLSMFSPYEVHSSIDRAIEEAFPSFYDITNNESLVLEEDTIEYDISSLTPWIITGIFFENAVDTYSGVATGGAATTLLDTTANFSTISAGFQLSIYAGTGSGQTRAVTSVTGTTQLNVATWVVNPDTTSKYKVWNPSLQKSDWQRQNAVRFDSREYPQKMYFTQIYPAYYGMRIRLQYTTMPTVMATDATTTYVPKEYIVNKALANLCQSRTLDNRVDRQKWLNAERSYSERAERYKQLNGWQLPTVDIWQETDYTSGTMRTSSINPLGW